MAWSPSWCVQSSKDALMNQATPILSSCHMKRIKCYNAECLCQQKQAMLEH